MARKQSDYLAGLLAQDTPSPAPAAPVEARAAPAPAVGRAGMSLLGRESALARVASGEVRQVTQLQLDPARVRVWHGNARIQTRLSEEAVRDLIDSILAEGGQKVPVVVRHISGDADHDYEVIAGTRRHFAISWLRANNYPELKLLAQVADLDDEAAFRLADIENRARKDVSDIERARNYAEALTSHYGGKAVRMAERLKLSKGWLSKMLKAATIGDEVLCAFANLGELPLNPAYALAVALDDKVRAKAIATEAKLIARQNEAALAKAAPALPGPVVIKRLMAATATPQDPAKPPLVEVTGQLGRPILCVKSVTRQGVTLHVPIGGGASDADLEAAFQTVLQALREQGVRLA